MNDTTECKPCPVQNDNISAKTSSIWSDGLFHSKQSGLTDAQEISRIWLAPCDIPVPPQSNIEITDLHETWNKSSSDLSASSEHTSMDSNLLSMSHLAHSENPNLTLLCRPTDTDTPHLTDIAAINLQDLHEVAEELQSTLSQSVSSATSQGKMVSGSFDSFVILLFLYPF